MLSNKKYYYFIGIGGIGMSALARYFNASGNMVCGYDKTTSTLTDELMLEGIDIHFEDNINMISKHFTDKDKKENILIIYTPAVPNTHSELCYFRDNNFDVVKRSELLGEITKAGYTIAVAGTHGKTTVSSMIAHLFNEGGINCTAFLGGICLNFNSNLLLGNEKEKKVIVAEADEYDRSFLFLEPDFAVVTSMDADHLDIYKDENKMRESYIQFMRQVKKGGVLLLNKSCFDFRPQECQNTTITYSVDLPADYHAENVKVKNGKYLFDVITPRGAIRNISSGLPGRHNMENAIAAIAAAQISGINEDVIKKSVSTYKGVKRRFEYHIKKSNMIYIDDYAHHPAELKACINSVKELYPDKKITGIFQPHLYSRTRDFADDFARSLELLDDLILLEIYPARELPIEGVNAKMLFDKIKMRSKKLSSYQSLVEEINPGAFEILLTLGAGDIDRLVEPVKNKLMKHIHNAQYEKNH